MTAADNLPARNATSTGNKRNATSTGNKRGPKRPKPTLADVASLAGISRRVAGHVLNSGEGNTRVSKETCNRVQEAAKTISYYPNHAARVLRGKRSHVVGVLVASAGDPLRSFLVQYLDAEADLIGCNTVIANTWSFSQFGQKEFGRRVEEFERRGTDGVLCAVHHWFGGDRVDLLRRIPNTVFYEDPGIPGAAHVAVDRYEAMRLAVRHLFERGRRRIGLAVMSRTRATHIDRCRGHEAELRRNGLPFTDDLVFDASKYGTVATTVDEETGLWSFPEHVIDDLIDSLVGGAHADAIVVHDDFWAAILLKKLRARGIRVPDDIAVVGYLNHYLCDWTDPSLTTFDLRHREAARQMMLLLERMIGGKQLSEEERTVNLQPQLVVREST